jgi:hypothetical protein
VIVITRLARVIHFQEKNKLNRPHKAGDDSCWGLPACAGDDT